MTSFERRAARARALAERHPEARAPLELYAAVADFQASAAPGDLDALKTLVLERGPEALRSVAASMNAAEREEAIADYRSGRDRSSPRSFFARVLLQVAPPLEPGEPASGHCPRCGHPPQAGALREEGHGTALFLVCSLCFESWRWPRVRCPSCGESDETKLSYYDAPEMRYVQVRACESCLRYLLVVRIDLEPDAIPEVDEIAAIALDVWARERGLTKIQPNLAGI